MLGITSFGAYIPRLRLVRAVGAQANAWFNSAVLAQSRGERAMANWDEDALTMAVEAARDALSGRARDDIGAVFFGSTTHPFADRQNAGLLAGALDLPEAIVASDLAGSQKAGTGTLLAALNHAAAGHRGESLAVAGEHRRARAGSVQELLYGDAAAAFSIGRDQVIAEFLGSHSTSVDFVDHYRRADSDFEYHWEERWIRDEGYMKLVPASIAAALAKLEIDGASVDHFILPENTAKLAAAVAKRCGIAESSARDGLLGNVGLTGAAHPLLLLAHALEDARPGQTIIVVGFGQGCDVLAFRTTEALGRLARRHAVSGSLARRKEERNYQKFMAFNEVLVMEKGLRAESNPQTALTTQYRHRRMLLGLVGGRCTQCGTPQLPPADVCVNPACQHTGPMSPYRFADEPARIKTWSADNLTFTPDPPAHYGMVEFERGGRFMADITDYDVGAVSVGQAVRMVFRVRGRDPVRGITRYFWKAAPVYGAKEA